MLRISLKQAERLQKITGISDKRPLPVVQTFSDKNRTEWMNDAAEGRPERRSFSQQKKKGCVCMLQTENVTADLYSGKELVKQVH